MELDDHAFLNELLAMRKEPWDVSFPTALGDLFSAEGGGSFDCCFDEPGPICGAAGGVFAPLPNATTATYGDVGETSGLTFGCYNPAVICPTPPISFGGRFLPAVPPDIQSSCSTSTTSNQGAAIYALTSSSKEDCRADLEAEELGLVHGVHSHGPGGSGHVVCKVEELNQLSSLEGRGTINSNAAMAFPLAPFDGGSSSSSGPPEGKGRAKKLDGQPSKNLMAERRRRKRLNDRLSMLRSVVPKISKVQRHLVFHVFFLFFFLKREGGDMLSPSGPVPVEP